MTEGPLRTRARCGPRKCTEACTTVTWQRTGARCIAASSAQRVSAPELGAALLRFGAFEFLPAFRLFFALSFGW